MTTAHEVESKWTHETVYGRFSEFYRWPPPCDPDLLDNLRANPSGHPFMPEFVESLLSETKWMRISSTSVDRSGPPATGEQCNQCSGKGKVKVLYLGKITGMITSRLFACNCDKDKRFLRMVDSGTPLRFRDVRLESLAPSSQSMLATARQVEIITSLQAHPDNSYFLHGTPGTGKSHMASALFHHAAWRNLCAESTRQDLKAAVWRVSAATLLREHKDWETRDKDGRVELPTVTERAVRNAAAKGYRPSLFIDEIDKFSTTEFRVNTLAEIVNAVYEERGQIVATSNKSPAELSAKWGADEAGTILRRIGAEVGAHTIEFS